MAEITSNDEAAVKHLLQTDFGVGNDLAGAYTKIALFLSDDAKWQPWVDTLSSLLETEYWNIVCQEQATGGARSNLMTRAIAKLAAAFKFAPHVGVVYGGFVSESTFIDYVHERAFWKDAVSSNHGEHSHSFQWLMLAGAGVIEAKQVALVYSRSVDYKSTANYYHAGSGTEKVVYLWDFLVDCFDFGRDPDYKKNITTHTARSPTALNTYIFQQNNWLGDYLRGRYQRHVWNAPGSNTPTSIKEYATQKHSTKANFTAEGGNVFQRKPNQSTKHASNWQPVGDPYGGAEKTGIVVSTKSGWGTGAATNYWVEFSPVPNSAVRYKVDAGETSVAATLTTAPKGVKFKLRSAGTSAVAHGLQAVA